MRAGSGCDSRLRAARFAAVAAAVGVFALMATPAPMAQSVTMSDAHLKRLAAPYDAGALERLRAWQALIAAYPDSPEPSQREAANDFFNAIPWVSDDEAWGKRDYWASPVEFLGRNAGDCEDYSIAKFFTLKELGVREARLLITYVRATTLNQAHMVLAYYPRPGSEPLILDNLDPAIKPASRRPDLIPVYSFNGTGLWRGIQRTQGNRAGSAKRLAGWRTMLRRLNTDLAARSG